MGTGERIGQLVEIGWFVAVVIGAAIVAARNVRLGRGDRRAAIRLAIYLGAMRMMWFLGAHHLPTGAEIGIFSGHLAWAMFRVGLVWIFYLALEPYARRLWPRMLVTWVRLLNGRCRDPQVGRDILVGCLYGVFFAISLRLVMWLPDLLGQPSVRPGAELISLDSLRGLRQAMTAVFAIHVESVMNIFFGITLFIALRLLLRRTWLAVPATTILAILMFNPNEGSLWAFVAFFLVALSAFWFVLFRFGLLPVMIGASIGALLETMPLTFDLTAWYAHASVLTILVIVGVLVWGFTVSLAGRPLFRDELLDAGAGVRS